MEYGLGANDNGFSITNTAIGDFAGATGYHSTATGTNSTAIGYGATSTGNNSVALGSNSTDGGQSNVVFVGSAGNERRITNVASGIANTDAVNVTQLNNTAASTLSSANAYTNSKINNLSQEAHRGIAGAIAMSRSFMPLNPGESGIGAGFGESAGQGDVASILPALHEG